GPPPASTSSSGAPEPLHHGPGSDRAATIARAEGAAMFSNLPPVTKALLIANALVFVLQLLLGDFALAAFMLWPLGVGAGAPAPYEFLPWQLLTYGFMHGSFGHLAFNMLALLMFGAPLEHVWGDRRF